MHKHTKIRRANKKIIQQTSVVAKKIETVLNALIIIDFTIAVWAVQFPYFFVRGFGLFGQGFGVLDALLRFGQVRGRASVLHHPLQPLGRPFLQL